MINLSLDKRVGGRERRERRGGSCYGLGIGGVDNCWPLGLKNNARHHVVSVHLGEMKLLLITLGGCIVMNALTLFTQCLDRFIP